MADTDLKPTGFDRRAAWDLAGKRVEDDEEAPKRIADRTAMLEQVRTWPNADRSSREFMELLWHDQRVLGHMGNGEYDLATAIDDEQFRANAATAIGAPLPEDRDERVKALAQVAENLMGLARPHTVRVGGSGKGDKPVIQAWRLMTAVFPHDLVGATASGADSAYDLVVLARGTLRLVKRGVDRDYVEVRADLRGIRGKIDASEMAKRALRRRGLAACEYEELSIDVLHNRILRSTLDRLGRLPDLDGKVRGEVRSACKKFAGVRRLTLDRGLFGSGAATSQSTDVPLPAVRLPPGPRAARH